MKALKCVLAVTVSLLVVSSFSFAEDLTRTGPCEKDIKMFCKNVKPGKGRILRCMRQYETYLSTSCIDHISEVKEKTRLFIKACKNDTGKFCNNVEPGQGNVYRCLKQHREELAARCANLVD